MIVEMTLTGLLILLAVNVLISLVRVIRGPTGRDRLTGVLFAGTTGAAIMLIGSVLTDQPALRDIALGLVALAAVIVVVRLAAETQRRSAS